MFHSAAVKLTLWYLAIIMAISLVFSLALYSVSSNDLGHNINRQVRYFNDLLAPDQSNAYGVLRSHQLDQDLSHLRDNLVLFNIVVLICGGVASYWLARRTLSPIEEALDAQTRFASDASHELRTPLTAIQTENEVALRNRELTKTQAVAVIQSNLEEVAKLKALSEGLLRLANGNGAIDNPQTVALKTAIAKSIERYHKTASAKKIKLVNKSKPVNITGDPDSIVELISVFLDNAIKYSPPGREVKIWSERHGKTAVIRIADQGQGIKQAELPHIFDRFYRADASRNKLSDSGYGLGLAIAKKIADAHHGHIEVESSLGKGTTFSVFLPAA